MEGSQIGHLPVSFLSKIWCATNYYQFLGISSMHNLSVGGSHSCNVDMINNQGLYQVFHIICPMINNCAVTAILTVFSSVLTMAIRLGYFEDKSQA